ncbi:MAG TPA: EI24 domain-containing protein [Ferruginibacter sp.]|jgi:CysZ protein|nr:EI24 domain-containing protein [Ferruginibacter sp.]HMU23969.1 EI24 domain-containing protein [Ferruginibacter sp.]
MLKEIVIAIQSYLEAHRFISRHKLWKWILIPGFLYTLMFMAGIWLFWVTSNEATQLLLNKTGIREWLENFKNGWMNFLVIICQIIIWMVSLMFYFSLFKFIFLIIGSPLFSYLSEKTDTILTGKDFPFSFSKLMNDAWRAIKIALRNLLWQSLYMLSLFLLSFFPLFGWVTPLVGLLVECYYLGFSMLDYSSERNNLSAMQSIQFIGRHKGLAIGNGFVFYLMHLVPIIGWLLAPSYAVIAATLSLHKARNEKVIIG